VGVLVGSVIGDHVPLVWVKRAAATAFIIIGILMLFDKF
jgi:putative Ca2+/H+ antiporter (TMEM165/GDT1 family)